MKISKINHIRSNYSIIPVKNKDYIDHEGILYKTIGENDEYQGLDLHEHIQNRNNSAKGLYTIFFPEVTIFGSKGKRKEQAEKLISDFNGMILKILKSQKDEDQNKRISNAVSAFCRIDVSSNLIKVDDNTISMLVNKNLRKSLRKNLKIEKTETLYFPELLIKILSALYVSSDPSFLTDAELNVFFTALDRDYRKTDQMEQIENSIRKQKVHVDVVERDGKFMLRPSNADHPKKKYAFEFLTEFCRADDAGKNKLTDHIERLILLYFYGKEGYQSEVGITQKDFSKDDYFILSLPEIKAGLQNMRAEKEDFISQKKKKEIEKKPLDDKKRKLERDREKTDNLTEKTEIENQINEIVEKISMLRTEIAQLKDQIAERNKIIDDLELQKQREIEQQMAKNYQESVKYLLKEKQHILLGDNNSSKNCSSEDLYWLDYIDRVVKKIALTKANRDLDYRLTKGYLCIHVWKEWTQYIASKYIDLGKGVYHFVVPNLSGVANGEKTEICEISHEFQSGISGFEYERIKAEESLEREMAEYVSFAVNNFGRACADDAERSIEMHEDVLQMKTDSTKDNKNITLYPDADRRILQFFGGKTQFVEKKSAIIAFSKEQLFEGIRDELNAVRNTSFHFTAKKNQYVNVNHTVANAFFKEEMEQLGVLYQEKYFTNNVPVFYPRNIIDQIMKTIYSGKKERVALVPSFNKLFARTSLPQSMDSFVDRDCLRDIQRYGDDMKLEMFWSCLFFVLKEIYYNDFLQNEENVKELFLNALNEMLTDKKSSKKDRRATKAFKQRLDELGERSFGEICQAMMVDYMLQNSENSKVKTQNTQNHKKDYDQIYKHFRTILYNCIRAAFHKYLKNTWKILSEPIIQNHVYEKKSFCTGCSISLFDHLKESFMQDALMPSWYIAAHFMNPTYLNHLIGSIRNYIQFTSDIERRAQSVYNRLDADYNTKVESYKRIVEILEFTIHFCSKTSEHLKDYFGETDAENAYAQFLAYFVEFPLKDFQDAKSALNAFCDRKIKLKNGTEIAVGIYSNGKDLILNKNIVHANMYGNIEALKDCMKKIRLSEIRDYYLLKEELIKVFNNGVCTTEEEQKKLREFQNARNRIELLDITIFTEIVNDMQAQLISWSYLRERDLMYYQLGYYYTKLFWTCSISDKDHRRELIGESINIPRGAILYQILAMNNYSLGIIGDKKGEIKFVSRGGDIKTSTDKFRKNFVNGKEFYNEGLSLFEYTDEHSEISDTRNYIDHFKYYTKHDRSLVELYSEIYDRYFRYNHNLKKSVPLCMDNIMARYFMIIEKEMKIRQKKINGQVHKATSIVIPQNGIKSSALTYYIQSKKKNGSGQREAVLVDARSDVFISEWYKILNYKR